MTPVKIWERALVSVYATDAVTAGLFNLLDTEDNLANWVQDFL